MRAEPGSLSAVFRRRFGRQPAVRARVPGRVNLIGGHLDYHEGLVLPLAIDRHLEVWAWPRPDSLVRICSETTGVAVQIDLTLSEAAAEVLARYAQAAAQTLRDRQLLTRGCDILVNGTLPAGAGLSSSSALVSGLIAVLAWRESLSLSPLELAQLACAAEHRFGTTGGIMDQYVIAHGRAGAALLIDCRSLTHEAIALPAAAGLVVAHTGAVRHQLATPFAQRRREAAAGFELLQRVCPELRTLRDVTPALLASAEARLRAADPSGAWLRRCRHVVNECARVPRAADALRAGDLAAFGALMTEAHASLRDDYEVTSPPVEAMIAAALAHPACYGARMTGGGFGGCTVNLVQADAIPDFCQHLARSYRERTGRAPMVFPVQAADGLRVQEL